MDLVSSVSKVHVNSSFEYESLNKINKDVVLGPITDESLQKIKNELVFSKIPFEGYIKKKDITIQQNVSNIDRTLRWKFNDSVNNETIYLDLLSIQPVDGIELQVLLTGNHNNLELDDLDYNCFLYIDYYSENEWINIVDNFDLRRIIYGSDSDIINLKTGKIQFSVNTNKLRIRFNCILKEDKSHHQYRRFNYSGHDFDTNGILYWIGTNGYKEKRWINPSETGKIKLEISHDKMYDIVEMRKSSIISRDIREPTYWGGTAPQYFTIDLGPDIQAYVDHYTLRHGHYSSNSFIYNWQFMGSNDGDNWDILHEQVESPFSYEFESKTFEVPNPKRFYRYFRVLQKGNYSMGSHEGEALPYLCINGFEIYGELKASFTSNLLFKSISQINLSVLSLYPFYGNVTTQTMDYVNDFDTNGLIYWIGTNGLTSPFFNPVLSGQIKLDISHQMYSPEMCKHTIIEREKVSPTYWGGSSPQWFTIDLGENNLFMCKAYTLRHGYSSANSFLYNWELHGSLNKKKWEILHSSSEQAFTKSFETKTWFTTSNNKKFYRYFRVLQKGNYSMGSGKSKKGSPYICIAGFELYGERLIASLPISKHIDHSKINRIRLLKSNLFLDKSYHLRLVQLVHKLSCSISLKTKCLDWILDVLSNSILDNKYLIEAFDLSNFIFTNIVKAPKQISEKACRILNLIIHSDIENIRRIVLDLLLDQFIEWHSYFNNVDNFHYYMMFISSLCDFKAENIQRKFIDILLNINNLIKIEKSRFYNILQSKFGLFERVLEQNKFTSEKNSNLSIQSKSQTKLKTITDIESNFLQLQTKFESKKRSLISFLERTGHINQKSVYKAYKECLDLQEQIFLAKEQIKLIKPDHPIALDISDCSFDRKVYIAEYILKFINSKSSYTEMSESYTLNQFYQMFKSLCVYGTPILRHEGTKYLFKILTNHKEYPLKILVKYFTSISKNNLSKNQFPIDFAYESLLVLMSQEDYLLYYVKELFGIISNFIEPNVEIIDINLIIWVLSLLENLMKSIPVYDSYKIFQDQFQQINTLKPLYITFKLLLSCTSEQQISSIKFFSANNIIRELSKRYDPKGIHIEIFSQEGFDNLFSSLINFNPIYISATIQTFSQIFSDMNYYLVKFKDQYEYDDDTLESIKESHQIFLKSLSQNLNDNINESPILYSELLLVLFNAISIFNKTIKNSQITLNESKSFNIIELLIYNIHKLTSIDNMNKARLCCITLKLLKQFDYSLLMEYNDLFSIFSICLTTSEEYQFLIKDDLLDFAEQLLSSSETSSTFQYKIFDEIVKVFEQVRGNNRTSVLYKQFIELFMKNISKKVLKSIKPESLIQLLNGCFAYIVSMSKKEILTSPIIKKVVIPTLYLCEIILMLPHLAKEVRSSMLNISNSHSNGISFPSLMIEFFRNAEVDVDHIIVRKTSLLNSCEKIIKCSLRIIQSFSKDIQATKHFIELCLNSLRLNSQSRVLYKVLLILIRSEEIALYFCIDLKGYEFMISLFKGITHYAPTLHKYNNQLSSSNNNEDGLINFTQKITVIEPSNDPLLSTLFKGNIWACNSIDQTKKKFTMILSLNEVSILKEIHVSFDTTYSQLCIPEFITVEIGTSLDLFLPVGCLKVNKSNNSNTQNVLYINEYETASYLKLNFICKKKTNSFTINNIKVLGYSAEPYPTLYDNETLDDMFPIMLYLQTLDQCTKYEQVQKHIISNHSDSLGLALKLLNISDTKLLYIIQRFLYNISYNDVKMADQIFDYILNNQTSYPLFTSKLCLFACENAQSRIMKLSNHITTSLKTQNNNSIYFIESLALVIYRLSQRNNVQLEISLDVISDVFNEIVRYNNESNYIHSLLKLLSSYISKDGNIFAYLLSKYIKIDEIDHIIMNNYPIVQYIGYLGGKNAFTTKLLIEHNFLNFLSLWIKRKDVDPEIIERMLSFLTDIAQNNEAKKWIGKHLYNICFKLIISPDTPTNIIFKVHNLLIKSQNLCFENKEKIAKFILNIMKSNKTKIKKSYFKFITELLVLEDQVSVILTPKNDTSIENHTLSHLYKEKSFIIEMDKEYTHENIELSEDNQVIKAADVPSKWRTSISKKGYSQGFHTWDVKIEDCTSYSNIMIGVCEKDHNLNLWLGQSQSNQGWSYYGSTAGYTYHNGVLESGYGKMFKKGDIVHVYLDMDNGTLGFGLNGEDFGVAFSSDIYGRELYPAVSLYDSGDTLRISQSIENEKSGRPVESTEALYFHTPFKPFKFPISTTLDSVALNILPNKLKYTHGVEFEYHYPKRNEYIGVLDKMNTKLEDIVQILDDGIEIIELRFLICQMDEVQDKKLIHTISGRNRDHYWPIFDIFSNNGGFILLINELIDQIECKLFIRRDKDMKSNKYLLRSLLTFTSVDGFIEAFLKDNECRAILLKIMYELQNFSYKDIEAKITSILPEVNIEALQDPYGCFVKVFIDILSSREEKSIMELISIRNKIINSDVINRMLVELMFLLDILPRDPDYKFFKPYVRKYYEEKKRKAKKHKIQPKTSISPSKGSWNKGTGYCTEDEDDSQYEWEQDTNFKEQNIKNKKASQILKAIASVLRIYPESTDHIPKQHELDTNFYEAFIASSIGPLLESYYRNNSILDIVTNFELYNEILNISRAMAGHEKLILLFGKIPNQSILLIDLLENLYVMSCETLSFEQEYEDEELSESPLLSDDDEFIDNELLDELILDRNIHFSEMVTAKEGSHLIIATEIKNTYTLIKEIWDKYCESNPDIYSIPTKNKVIIDDSIYVKKLQEYQLQEFDMKDPKTGEYNHHFKNRITLEPSSSYKVKRIIHELSSLRTSLPLHESSSIFLSVDLERIDIMKAIIIGPENTPYENGCFIFDIYCPPEYPKSPPLVNLQTTGNGSVRFNPNLYNCGKVCLSLLGTWRGGPNEKWSEHTSTLLQVLISIQSLIFVNEPYFNEPGYENLIGTEEGKQQSLIYNETIKVATLRWGLVNQLKNPIPEFKEVIKLHFSLKRDSIIKQTKRWLSEAKKSDTPEHYETMKKIVDELYIALQELEPFEIKNEEESIEDEEPDLLSNKEIVLQELEASLPGFIPELYVKALELNNGDYINSINWLLDNGENYLLKHPELLSPNKREKKISKKS